MRTLTFNRIIGAGAMGTVYHAELRVPRGFTRTCAVKVMKSGSPDQEHFRARMRDEARLLGMLQDELILGVAELVVVEGRDAVIMEFVEGVDLAELVRQGSVPPRALAELGAEVAGTLGRAHAARHPQTDQPLKVIHRDIKPANIMVTSRGGIRVLDFGVARAAFASRESQTQGLVLGTLNYFPPEILAGKDPTPAVDLYGLGLTMWECATGQDWGAPRVRRDQFEQRVERRLAELPTDYKPIVPALKRMLEWEPTLRPDGKTLESMLLQAADQCAGKSLRSWGRDVVPGIISTRKIKIQADPLLGRTVELKSDPVPLPGAKPLAENSSSGSDLASGGDLGQILEEAESAPQYQTFNDIGPMAAVERTPEERKGTEGVTDELVAVETPRTPRPKSRKKKKSGGVGVSLWVMVAIGILLGGTLGLVILVAIAVIAVLISG